MILTKSSPSNDRYRFLTTPFLIRVGTIADLRFKPVMSGTRQKGRVISISTPIINGCSIVIDKGLWNSYNRVEKVYMSLNHIKGALYWIQFPKSILTKI